MDIELPTIESIKRFVEMKRGVAIVPRMCVEREIARGDLREVALEANAHAAAVISRRTGRIVRFRRPRRSWWTILRGKPEGARSGASGTARLTDRFVTFDRPSHAFAANSSSAALIRDKVLAYFFSVSAHANPEMLRRVEETTGNHARLVLLHQKLAKGVGVARRELRKCDRARLGPNCEQVLSRIEEGFQ